MNDTNSTTAFNTLDVIIPTYNGGQRLLEALQKIEQQDFAGEVGIIIVDSGSTDGSIEEIVQRDNVKLIRISQQEFSHSHARNLGAKKSDADALVFMTQDAVPISNDWLSHMVQPLREGYAATSCTDNTDNCPDLFYKVGTWRYQKDMKIYHEDRVCEYRQDMDKGEVRFNSILNNVACCISRNLFLKYLFEGKYAEDLQLGKRLIEDGYRLKILGTVGVDHYHERSQFYHLKRQYIELRALDSIMEWESEKIDSPQEAWLFCQMIWGLSRTFDRLEFVGKFFAGRSSKANCMFLFLVRQVLKSVERKNLISCDNENISSYWDDEIRGAYERAMKYYEYIPTVRNPIVELRDYLRTGLEPYIKENDLNIGFEDIKRCIFKEAARLSGAYLARSDFAESIFPGLMERV